MPKVIKKRPAKKKPVQENEVKSAALEALDKIKERRKQVIMWVSIVLGVVVLYAAFAMYSSSMSDKAYSLEREAYKYYYGEISDKSMPEVERWKKALELYKKSVDAKVTPTALFYAGNSYYNLKDYDNALKQYVRFTEKFSGDKKILPLVYQKMSSAYLRTNQKDKAINILGKLAGIDNGIFKDTALVLEARLYEETGDKVKALEKYKEIMTKHPASPWSNEAGARVSAEEAKNKTGAAESTTAAPGAAQPEPAAPK
ncbi:MAG: tetratricopeptide repeat protein [Nitrospirae bacterium]|nr:tetratricopeptide repeat protein [Nitrospirota bacterium]